MHSIGKVWVTGPRRWKCSGEPQVVTRTGPCWSNNALPAFNATVRSVGASLAARLNVGAPLEVRTERSEATEDCLSAVLSETCRGLKCLIALRAISFLRKVRTSRGVIRFAHPSGRTERRALLRYAPFLQRLRRKLGGWELSDLSLSHERSSPLPPRGPVVRHLLAQFRIPALAFHKSQVLLRLAGESELLGENLCQQQIGVA